MTLGERISSKRKECGISQEALGEKLSVSRQTIYKWESDQAIPEFQWNKILNTVRMLHLVFYKTGQRHHYIFYGILFGYPLSFPMSPGK